MTPPELHDLAVVRPTEPAALPVPVPVAPWRGGELTVPRRVVAGLAALVCLVAGWRLAEAGAPADVLLAGRAEAAVASLGVGPAAAAAMDAERSQALTDLRALRIASRALNYLRQRYVDPDKIDPPAMLEEGLQAVAHLVPEMLVDAPRRTADGLPAELRVRIGEASLALPLEGLSDTFRLNWFLLRAIRFVADRLPADVPPGRIEYVAVNGVLDTLDPYSHMLDPDAWRDMLTNTGGNFGGLGIVILTTDGVLTIQSVLPGSPAEKAGLQAGDQILQIDGEDTLNMAVDEAVDRLRGEVGTSARLVVRRGDRETGAQARPQEVVVVRAVIHLQSVEAKVLDNGIGYARIKNFQRGTADELGDAVDNLLRNGAQNGLVLDLRDNPGGLLDEAIRVCDLFIASGPAVITVTGGQRQRDVRPVTGEGRFSRMALAVLLNGHSASASEVVAGALKYSGRAIVLGDQSFGKASVQVPYEIGGGALKLTVAKYLVPGDINIHGVGIAPDIGVQFVSATREQVSLFGASRPRRAAKKARGAAQQVRPVEPPRHQLRVLLPDFGDKVDRSVVEGPAEVMEREPRERAATLLRRAGDPRAAVTLATAAADLAEMARADDAELVAHLKRQGIDWRPGERVGDPPLRVVIAGGDAGFQVEAGDVLRLSVTLTNLGKVPLHRLHVLTACDDPALDRHEQLVGRLEPGASRTVHLRVRISVRHGDLQVPLDVVAAQDGVELPLRDRTLVTLRGRALPEFALRFTLDDAAEGALDGALEGTHDPRGEAATADGVLQPGETAHLRVEVRNQGQGLAQATVARLRSLSGQRLHLEEGRVRLGQIAPDGQAIARFRVTGTAAAAPGRSARTDDDAPVRVELVLADEALGVERRTVLEIPWSRKPLRTAPKAVAERLARAGRSAAEIWDNPPHIELQPVDADAPPGLVPPLTGACSLDLQGVASFDARAPQRRFVTASVGGVKQTYHAGHGQAEVPFKSRLRLDSGLNAVTIQAQAGPHQVAERQLLVHCTPAPP